MAVYTITASVSDTTEALDLTNKGPISYQAVATGLDAADGVLSVEYSNDGVNFEQVPNLTAILPIGAGQTHFNINTVNHKFYRANWVAGSNTAGTIVITTSK